VKLSDSLSGLLVLLLGLAVIAHASTFPPMPGQAIGPALFPALVGAGLVLVGARLFWGGRSTGRGWGAIDEDMRRPRMALNFAIVIASLVAYAVLVGRLGFFITAALLLGVLLRAFGVRPRPTLLLAALLPFALHYIFYSLLHVPLPWGVFEGLAW
jgi:putative tricarboxylic transport membrane protein